MKFRSKSVVVEAYRFLGGHDPQGVGWSIDWLTVTHWFSADGKHAFFRNRYGQVDVLKGNWIVKSNGEFFAAAEDLFDQFYESADMVSEVPAVYVEAAAAAESFHVMLREMSCEQPLEALIDISVDPELSGELVKRLNCLNVALKAVKVYKEN